MVLTLVNAFGAKMMGRSETLIVAIKVAILVLFAGVGLWFIKPANLSPDLWPTPKSILFGAGVLFIGYEGFGLVTNAAGDMRRPAADAAAGLVHQRDPGDRHLPGGVGDRDRQLDERADRQAQDYALAEAARPFLGEFGFRLIAIAALFSTASAINATLFGSANVCYMIAKDGELPAGCRGANGSKLTGGLLLTTALVLVMMLAFDLSGIAMMGSAAFLLVYAVVNAGHLRVLQADRRQRGHDGLTATLVRQRAAFLRDGPPSLAQRCSDLMMLKNALREHREDFVAAINTDFGHRSRQETSLFDLSTVAEGINYLHRNLRRWVRPERRRVGLPFFPVTNRVLYQPLGVVGIISPWNYPLALALMPLATALAAGNRAMIKPSELTPQTSAMMKSVLNKVFADDQVAVVTGDSSVGIEFSRLPFDHLLFTGSTTVGRSIMRAASDNLVPVTLELGGKVARHRRARLFS